MEKNNFNQIEFIRLINDRKASDLTYKDAIDYFTQRVRLTKLGYFYVIDGVDCFDDVTKFERDFFKPISDKMFFKKLKVQQFMYTFIYDLTKPEIDDVNKTINLTPKPKYANMELVETKETKLFMETFKKFLLEVISANNMDVYNYILKWISNIIHGVKNDTLLNIVSHTEGTGKSTLSDILIALLTEKICCRPSLKEISGFNIGLLGKILVNIEETEDHNLGHSDLCSKLKGMITQSTYKYEGKGKDFIEQKCLSNFIITSNHPINVLKGRRDFNLTPSCDWLGRKELFAILHNTSPANLNALYHFLMSIDVSNFKSQDVPIIDTNVEKKIDNMNNAFLFIKNTYVMQKISMRVKKTELFAEYQNQVSRFRQNKHNFYDRISELNIRKCILDGYEYFDIDHLKVYEELKKRMLISVEDEQILRDMNNEKDDNDNSENQRLLKLIDKLQKENDELKKLLNTDKKDEEEEPKLKSKRPKK